MKKYYIAILLGLLTIIIYAAFYRGEQVHLNYFVPLAEAFLNGRLYLLENPAWLNELINISGRYYVVYPPMPAILLMPFVAVFGTSFPQPYLSIIIAGLNVSLSFLVFTKITKNIKISILVSLVYAFGSMQWYHAQIGSAWYIAHIIAMFFIWLMLLELFTRKRYWLVGLLIGAAYWSRLPAILAVVFPLLYFNQDFFNFKKLFLLKLKNIIWLSSGIGFFVLLNFIYNFYRFGVIFDISYQLLPVFEEPWYKYGLFNIKNIPIHLTEILTALPKFSNQPPYLVPSLNVLALWFVTPTTFLIFFAPFRQKFVYSLILTILVMSLPGLMHGSNGFTQFGFRFALDFFPFLFTLILIGATRSPKPLLIMLAVISIIINLWGVIMISHLGIWTL